MSASRLVSTKDEPRPGMKKTRPTRRGRRNSRTPHFRSASRRALDAVQASALPPSQTLNSPIRPGNLRDLVTRSCDGQPVAGNDSPWRLGVFTCSVRHATVPSERLPPLLNSTSAARSDAASAGRAKAIMNNAAKMIDRSCMRDAGLREDPTSSLTKVKIWLTKSRRMHCVHGRAVAL